MKGLILFDLDGTLLCTHRHLCDATADTLREMGLPAVSEEFVKSLIGVTLPAFCSAVAPHNTQAFETLFRKKERTALITSGRLYDGVPRMLSQLKEQGFQLAICSNGSEEYIHLALETTGIREMFQGVLSAKDFPSKGHAAQKMIAAGAWDSVIFVGDRSADFLVAKENSIPSIAAAYGYGDPGEASGATLVAHTPQDICSLVRQLDVYSRIEAKISQTPGVRCIGVNGVDTSGKTTFALQFAAYLKSRGKSAAIIHLDDFHNPKSVRTAGENPIIAYIHNAFDTNTLVEELLRPLKQQGHVEKELVLLDLECDTFSATRRYEIPPGTLAIVEGVLLYRSPAEDYIDFKIFLRVGFDEVLRRAAIRDVPKYGPSFLDNYREKYIPAEQWYLETCRPEEKSDVIVDNSDCCAPFIV